MTEVTDSTVAYLLLIVGAITGAAGLGWYLAGTLSTVVIGIIFLLVGYLAGLHIVGNNSEWFGFSTVALIIAGVFAYMLDIHVLAGIGLFALGLLFGLQTDRR
jgi:membrane-bound ClpP family serine protease